MKVKFAKQRILIIITLATIAAVSVILFYFIINEGQEIVVKQLKENEAKINITVNQSLFYGAIDKYPRPNRQNNLDIAGGIVPHHDLASDLTADFFSELSINSKIKTFIILGPNHSDISIAPAISGRVIWQTPLGEVLNNYDILEKLEKDSYIAFDEENFIQEYSIKTLTPFIKYYFPDAKIVPIIFSAKHGLNESLLLADKLESYLSEDTVLIFSLDFSHYLVSDLAADKDELTLAAIKDKDYEVISGLNSDYLDSPSALIILLKAMELAKAGDLQILQHTNSGKFLGQSPENTTSYVTGYFVRKIFNSLPENSDIKDPIRMLFFGDMMLDRAVDIKIKQNGLEYVFGRLDDISFFDNYNLVSVNLEGAVTNGGQHYNPLKMFDFAFHPKIITGLMEYNFNFFNLANNHFNDQGTQGIDETIENLDSLGLNHVGCGGGIVSDCSGKIVELKNKKIGMIGLSVLQNKFNLEKAEQIIAKLKDKTDFIAVNIHWGEEYSTDFNKAQQKIAYQLIDSGAGLIIGHHPHVVQGIEVYKNKPIFYSLGNFVFDQYFSEETQKGLAVELIFKEKKINFKLHPFKSQKSQADLMISVEKENFLQKISERSEVSEEFGEQIKAGNFILER